MAKAKQKTVQPTAEQKEKVQQGIQQGIQQAMQQTAEEANQQAVEKLVDELKAYSIDELKVKAFDLGTAMDNMQQSIKTLAARRQVVVSVIAAKQAAEQATQQK